MGWSLMWYSLQKGDGKDIGIAVDALGIAINWSEFRIWIEHIVTIFEIDDLPVYFFDLLDCENGSDMWDSNRWGTEKYFGVFRNFRPGWADSNEDDAVLWGIGYLRNHPDLPVIRTDIDQYVVSREEAAAALAHHPEVREWFDRFFEAIGKPGELSR